MSNNIKEIDFKDKVHLVLNDYLDLKVIQKGNQFEIAILYNNCADIFINYVNDIDEFYNL